MKCVRYILVVLLLASQALHAQKSNDGFISWSESISLPSVAGDHIGLAGVMGGVHHDVLLIAGGANFPDSMPWKGGRKKYYNDIYVLQKDAAGRYRWFDKPFRLPRPLAYGASVSYPGGVLCIGGENEKGVSNEVFLLQWDPGKKQVLVHNLPSLPVPLSNAAAALRGQTVYVAGGQTNGKTSSLFLSLDLNAATKWFSLPPLPEPVSHAVTVVQSNGEYPVLYLIGGRMKQDTGLTRFYHTTFEFDLKKKSWSRRRSLTDSSGNPVALSAATALASGSNSIFVFGGDPGRTYSRLEQYDLSIEAAATESDKRKLRSAKEQLLVAHEGFSKDIYLYNTITDTWTQAGRLPSSHVTTFATLWGRDILIPSGEIKPGVRSPAVLQGNIAPRQYFIWLDYLVLAVYLMLMVGIGMYTSKNQDTTEDYFRGGQRIPGWAAGLSIYGTQLSAITFMSIPAKTYSTNWNYFLLQMTIIMVIPIITRYFIPFYRKLQITTAYEYLEMRFNYGVRALASLLYVMLQIGRLAIVLLLPSLALTLVTGIDVNLCILLMGVITIFYTMKGGIEAVVWTDVAQVVILLGGALLCLIMIPFQLSGNFSSLWKTVQQEGKLDIIHEAFRFDEPTIWVVLLGGMAINVISYGADQSIVQKYMTTRDEAASRKSLRLGGWMALPSSLIFFTIGTFLYLYYKQHPQKINYQLQSQDAIFPWYIVSELPAGITGLLIAAVFAAAMSTLSSSMNSVTTALITDFYRKAFPLKNEKAYLRTAKYFTLSVGVLGTCLALVMAHWGISSLWDQFNTILGLFSGGLGGVFLLAIFTKRANAKGALAGLIISGTIQYYISRYSSVNLLLYAFTGMATCVLFGYLFSLFFGPQKKNIQGLTIYKTTNT